MNQDKKNLAARAAYHAYGQTTDNKNFQGNEMPEYDQLPEQIRTAWENASEAVANLVVNGFNSDLESAPQSAGGTEGVESGSEEQKTEGGEDVPGGEEGEGEKAAA